MSYASGEVTNINKVVEEDLTDKVIWAESGRKCSSQENLAE